MELSQEDINGTSALPFSYQGTCSRWLLWGRRQEHLTLLPPCTHLICVALCILCYWALLCRWNFLSKCYCEILRTGNVPICWYSGVSRRMSLLSRTCDVWNLFTLHFFFLLRTSFFPFLTKTIFIKFLQSHLMWEIVLFLDLNIKILIWKTISLWGGLNHFTMNLDSLFQRR